MFLNDKTFQPGQLRFVGDLFVPPETEQALAASLNGSGYRFLFGGTSSGRRANERSAIRFTFKNGAEIKLLA